MQSRSKCNRLRIGLLVTGLAGLGVQFASAMPERPNFSVREAGSKLFEKLGKNSQFKKLDKNLQEKVKNKLKESNLSEDAKKVLVVRVLGEKKMVDQMKRDGFETKLLQNIDKEIEQYNIDKALEHSKADPGTATSSESE